MKEGKEIVAILCDIRSSHNVGSIFRTADALGLDKIYLSGYTPPPQDKFGRVNKELAKVALGAEKSLAWEQSKNPARIISKLRSEGYRVVAVEQDDKSIDYKKFEPGKKAAFVFGNEVEGLAKNIISKCDHIVSIPMRGQKESLNVSVAFGIALARITDL